MSTGHDDRRARVIRVGAEPAPLISGDQQGKQQPKPSGTHSRGKPHQDRFRIINEFADAALGDLSRAEIAVWHGMPHVFQAIRGIPDGDRAIAEIADFIHAHTSAATGS